MCKYKKLMKVKPMTKLPSVPGMRTVMKATKSPYKPKIKGVNK